MCIVMHCRELEGDNPESFKELVHQSPAEATKNNEKRRKSWQSGKDSNWAPPEYTYTASPLRELAK
jgi:hypothetical protein